MIRNVSCFRFTIIIIIIIILLHCVSNRKPHFLDIIIIVCAWDSENAQDLIGILQYFGTSPQVVSQCVLYKYMQVCSVFLNTPLSSLAKIWDNLQSHFSSWRDKRSSRFSPSSEPFTMTNSYKRSKHQLLFIKLINLFDTKF